MRLHIAEQQLQVFVDVHPASMIAKLLPVAVTVIMS